MPSGTFVSAAAMLKAAAISGGVVTTSSRDVGGQAIPDLRQQVGVADQNFGAAVGQDVGDFLGLQMPVDRHHRAAQRRGGGRDFEERKIVAQHHADGRAAAEPNALKPAAARAMRAWISG